MKNIELVSQSVLYRKLVIAILFLLSFTLWIDALTGMFQFYTGVSIKLSVIYKIPLIVAMAIVIAVNTYKVFAVICAVFLLLVVGPSISFINSPKVKFLVYDISIAFKLITPFVAFYFCKVISRYDAELLGKYGLRILWLNFFAVVFNLLIGAAGFGYPSYALAEEEGGGIGVNGFYVAGNELSGCFVLLFGFVLHYFWNKESKKYFYLMSLFTLICGALIATKTTMLASIMLIFAIPLLNERRELFKFTKLKAYIFLPLLLSAAAIIFFIVDFLQSIGLYDKFIFILGEKGILGLIFSGRIDYSKAMFDYFSVVAGTFEFLFGIGATGISDFLFSKYSAEVDPVDLIVYVGVLGSLGVYVLLSFMIFPAFNRFYDNTFLPPIVILVNLILIMLSIFSGHILYSGMLGMIWGVLNGLVYVRFQEYKKKDMIEEKAVPLE